MPPTTMKRSLPKMVVLATAVMGGHRHVQHLGPKNWKWHKYEYINMI
jgi:hypothetical protein